MPIMHYAPSNELARWDPFRGYENGLVRLTLPKLKSEQQNVVTFTIH